MHHLSIDYRRHSVQTQEGIQIATSLVTLTCFALGNELRFAVGVMGLPIGLGEPVRSNGLSRLEWDGCSLVVPVTTVPCTPSLSGPFSDPPRLTQLKSTKVVQKRSRYRNILFNLTNCHPQNITYENRTRN